MIRSVIVVGIIAFIYFFVTSVAMPLCSPCEALLLGVLAGFLAAVYDKPRTAGNAAVRGGLAALIASIVGLIGGAAGYLIRVYVVFPPEATTSVANQLLGTEPSPMDATTDILSTVLSLGCCSTVDLILMAACGLLGGWLWHRWKRNAPGVEQPQGSS